MADARTKARVRQGDLAILLHRSRTTVGDWERGKTRAPAEAIRDYEIHLKLAPGTLTGPARRILGEAYGRTRSTQHIDHLRFVTAYGESQARRYQSVLGEVVKHQMTTFQELDVYRYWISSDVGDVVEEERVTTVESGEPLRWRSFGPGALPGSGVLHYFEDLDLQVRGPDAYRIEVLPVAVTPLRAELAAFFMPPVPPGETVRWAVQYRWPHLWDGLRDDEFDSGRINFMEYTSRAEIILVPPPERRDLKLVSRDPEVGEVVAASGPDNRLSWRIDRPRGPHSFDLRMPKHSKGSRSLSPPQDMGGASKERS